MHRSDATAVYNYQLNFMICRQSWCRVKVHWENVKQNKKIIENEFFNCNFADEKERKDSGRQRRGRSTQWQMSLSWVGSFFVFGHNLLCAVYENGAYELHNTHVRGEIKCWLPTIPHFVDAHLTYVLHFVVAHFIILWLVVSFGSTHRSSGTMLYAWSTTTTTEYDNDNYTRHS